MSNPAMVGEVNKLVQDLLLSVRMVCLPGIGTLRVERVGAKRLSKRSILPPHRIVTFSSQAEGEPFPNAIARAAGCDVVQAFTIYERWCSYALVNSVLTIEGVGVLKQKHFTPDAAFDKQLNPQGYAPMPLRPTRRFDWALWAGVVAILVAVGFGGYQFLQMQPDAGESVSQTTEITAATEVAPEQADAFAEAVVPEMPAVEETESAAVSEHPAQTTVAVDNLTPEAAPTPAQASDRLVSGRRYVVLGVFSTPENAARAAQTAEKRVLGIHCSVYAFGEKWMVSPFDAEDAAACSQFVNEYNDRLPDIWVYTAR